MFQIFCLHASAQLDSISVKLSCFIDKEAERTVNVLDFSHRVPVRTICKSGCRFLRFNLIYGGSCDRLITSLESFGRENMSVGAQKLQDYKES